MRCAEPGGLRGPLDDARRRDENVLHIALWRVTSGPPATAGRAAPITQGQCRERLQSRGMLDTKQPRRGRHQAATIRSISVAGWLVVVGPGNVHRWP